MKLSIYQSLRLEVRVKKEALEENEELYYALYDVLNANADNSLREDTLYTIAERLDDEAKSEFWLVMDKLGISSDTLAEYQHAQETNS